MIRDEDGQLTGYVYIDLNTKDYGGFRERGFDLLRAKNSRCPRLQHYTWSGELASLSPSQGEAENHSAGSVRS